MKEIFIKNKGYARMKELKAARIHTREIAKAVEQKIIEKIKPGLYKLVDYNWDENSGFIDICKANKKAVVCLLSAAAYYELTTFNPSQIYLAVPNNTDKFILDYPPIKLFYFSDKYYSLGIETIETKTGLFRIYNKEKTIVDLFRYSKRLGEDIALESIKKYLSNRKKRNIPKLIKYAKLCGVIKKIEPIVKAMVIE